jgi:hypothetical protein
MSKMSTTNPGSMAEASIPNVRVGIIAAAGIAKKLVKAASSFPTGLGKIVTGTC